MQGLPYREVSSSWTDEDENDDYDNVVTRREIIWKAVSRGVDVNAFIEQHTISFLPMAIMDEDFALVTFLLSQGANVTQFPKSGMCSPLHLAIGRFSDVFIHQTAKAIIACGANVDAYEFITPERSRFFPRDEDDDDSFENCCMYGGHPYNLGIPSFEATPIQAACLYGKMMAVQLLCEEGADIDAPAGELRGFTALQLALWKGEEDIVQYLLDAGIDVNAPSAADIGLTALQCAIFSKKPNIAMRLMSLGAEPGAPAARRIGCTALQAAVLTNEQQLVHTLLDLDVDVNATGGSEYGRTALQAACYKNSLELADILLQRNADVNAPPCKMGGATALQCAVMRGNFDLVVRLLDYGAEVDAPGAEVDGRTALQAAAENGRLDIVALLLQLHPDPLSLEEKCRDAATLAEKEKHVEVAKMLRAWKIPVFPFSHTAETFALEDLHGSLIMDEIDI